MSGSTSGAPSPGSNSPIMESAGFNPQEIDTFAKTNTGYGMTAEQIAALKNAGYNGQDYYSGRGYGEKNINDLVAKFNTWKESQARLGKEFNQYSLLAKEQPGRQATILTGPAATSDKSILGGV